MYAYEAAVRAEQMCRQILKGHQVLGADYFEKKV